MSNTLAFRLLSFVRIQKEEALVLGDGHEVLATIIKQIVGHRLVVAVRSRRTDGANADTPRANPDKSVVIVNGDGREQIDALARYEVVRRGFPLIVCLGRRDLVNATALPAFLRLWSRYLAHGGRIVLEMYRPSTETWTETASRYREAVKDTGFRLVMVNGFELDDTFPFTRIDMHARILSMRQTIEVVEEANDHAAENLRETAEVWKEKLEVANKALERPGYDPVFEMLDDILQGRRKLYATFRRC